MIEQTECIICGSSEAEHFISVKDRLSSRLETYNLVRCNCNFIYLRSRPDQKSISSYYESRDYDPHNNSKKSTRIKLYRIIQWFAIRWKYKKLNNSLSPGRILDIGGGQGEFAQYMHSKGWHIVMQDRFTELRDDYSSFKVVKELHQIENNHTFDVITLWHSLEHIHNIQDLFMHITRLLSSDGQLIIAVPNIQAPERKYFGSNWAPYDAPRHLYHFEAETLIKLCKKYNFIVLRKYSLYQDTPYNVLLSITKINIFNLIKFIIVSILSLFHTLVRGPKYSSSLLVICKKS